MNSEQTISWADNELILLSKAALDEMRSLAKKGDKLTPQTLKNAISERTDIQQLLKTKEGKPDVATDEAELKNELRRIQDQKKKLLVQLADLEDQNIDAEKIFKRIMLNILEFLRIEDAEALDQAIDQFKDLIKKNAPMDAIQTGFSSFKDYFLKENVKKKLTPDWDGAEKGKPPSFFERIRGKGEKLNSKAFESEYLQKFRVSYIEVVEDLRLLLGDAYLIQLTDISKKISETEHLEQFLSLTHDLRLLLKDYILNVGLDREKAAVFIREIGERIVDLERILIQSLKYAQEFFTADEKFGAVLEDHLVQLNSSVNFAETLEELKNAVVSKLSLIKDAIEVKRKEDQTRKDHVNEDVEGLKKHLEKMRQEMDAACQRADALEKELHVDPLTGASNRRAYDKRLREEMERFKRYQHAFSVFLFDVDYFKRINDQYGHATGDKCLVEIVKRVKPMLRDSDMLARYGGEEFIAILPGTNVAGATEVAEKLRRAVENIEFVHKKDTLRITVSIGVTEVLPTDGTYAVLFERMDSAMYDAKHQGRNRVIVK